MMKKVKAPTNLQDLTTQVMDNLPWAEVKELLGESKRIEGLLDKVSENVYRYVANEENQTQIIKSVLKSLKKSDPDHATLDKAEVLAQTMIRFAQMRINELEALRKTDKHGTHS